MKGHRILKNILLTGLLLVLTVSVVMASQELSGEEILDELKENDTLTGSGTATIKLTTENKQGKQRFNTLKLFRKEEDNNEKQLLEYLEPADVKGTKFLAITDENDENKMWLYLPALGRERSISGHQTRDKFMDTDFTYDELGGGQSYSEDYRAERLDDEDFEGYPCYLLKLTPEAEDSEYSMLKMWVWQEEMLPLKIQFYNTDEQLSKELISREIEENEDGEYMPYLIIMSDKLAGTRSIIEILETSSEDIDDEYFSLRYLRR